MLSGLDPHSAYLVPDDYQELQAGTSGEFGGLGIEVGMEDGSSRSLRRSTTPPRNKPASKRETWSSGSTTLR